jgi:hypothetical protein
MLASERAAFHADIQRNAHGDRHSSLTGDWIDVRFLRRTNDCYRHPRTAATGLPLADQADVSFRREIEGGFRKTRMSATGRFRQFA